MIEHRALITIASSEDRFRLGTERLIRQSYPPTAILMFYYREYGKRSLNNRNWVKTLCAAQSIRIHEVEVSFDPLDAWLKYTSTLRSYEFRTNEVVLDFTTAPREAIWTLIYLITRAGVGVSYVYHTPEAYNPDCLSRDPGEPRFMFKMSGLQDIRKPTILIVMTGFDPDRTEQLVTFYEPKLTLLGIQTGQQYENTKLNIERHERVLNVAP